LKSLENSSCSSIHVTILIEPGIVLGIHISPKFILNDDIIGKKIEKRFSIFLSPRLGINISLFHLRQFAKVWSELGSPMAGVEIGTG